MDTVILITFWTSITVAGYAYFGYPLVLWLIARCAAKPHKRDEIYPFVSIIIAAHNEEAGIRQKIENTLQLDYPKDSFEVIVASDASTDKTNSIVLSFTDEPVRLFAFHEHHGKTFAQNQAVKQAQGEIVLFADATTHFQPDLLLHIVKNFSDKNVGAVGAELIYENRRRTSVGEGNSLYWRYEKFIKKQESAITSLIGVSGCCYAVLKELYEPIDVDVISDFVIAQMIYKKGKRVVYEPRALSYEETSITSQDEFRMRVRVCTRTLFGLARMKGMLNPFRYGFYAIQLISHKIFRYAVPLCMVSIFVTSAFLMQKSVFFETMLMLQLIFYTLALMGWFTRRRKHHAFLYIPFYFCVTNVALFVGIIKFLSGKKMVVWRPIRTST